MASKQLNVFPAEAGIQFVGRSWTFIGVTKNIQTLGDVLLGLHNGNPKPDAGHRVPTRLASSGKQDFFTATLSREEYLSWSPW